MKVNLQKTKVVVSGAEGEVSLSKVQIHVVFVGSK